MEEKATTPGSGDGTSGQVPIKALNIPVATDAIGKLSLHKESTADRNEMNLENSDSQSKETKEDVNEAGAGEGQETNTKVSDLNRSGINNLLDVPKNVALKPMEARVMAENIVTDLVDTLKTTFLNTTGIPLDDYLCSHYYAKDNNF